MAKPKNTTTTRRHDGRAGDPGHSDLSATCPVAELARLQAGHIAAYYRLEGAHEGGHPWLQKAFSDIEAIEGQALRTRATSLEGAIFQIMLAWDEVYTLAAMGQSTPTGYRDKETIREIEAVHERIGRFLYSALTAVEGVAGVPRDEISGDYYMPAALDPAIETPAQAAGGAS